MDLELQRQLINLLIIAVGALAIIFVLRNLLRIAWRIVRVIVLTFILVMLVGSILGWIQLPAG